jgi:hypothetical protein
MDAQIHRSRKYEHPLALWAGIIAVTAGIILQLPMLYDARHNHYRLAGCLYHP